MICPTCGREINDTATFCPYCGNRVDSSPSPSEPVLEPVLVAAPEPSAAEPPTAEPVVVEPVGVEPVGVEPPVVEPPTAEPVVVEPPVVESNAVLPQDAYVAPAPPVAPPVYGDTPPTYAAASQGAPSATQSAPFSPPPAQVIGSGSYQSQMEPPKKKKTWLVVLIISLVVLCCLCSCITYFVFQAAATSTFVTQTTNVASTSSSSSRSASSASSSSQSSSATTAPQDLNAWVGQELTKNEHLSWTFGVARATSSGIIIDCSIENLSDTAFWIYIANSEVNGKSVYADLASDDIAAHSKATLALTISGVSSLSEISRLDLSLDVSSANNPYSTIKLYPVSFLPSSAV